MTRRRARNGTQRIPKAFTPDFNNLIVTRSSGFYQFAHAVTAFFGQVTTVHPVYQVANTSVLDQKFTTFVGSSTSNINIKFTIKKVKYKFYFDNLNGIAIRINITPISSYGSSGIGANSLICLDIHKFTKSLILSKAGVTGSVKSIEITIEPWKIEGFKSYAHFQSNSQWWQTIGAVGTQYTSMYIQGYTSDTSSSPTTGVNCTCTAEFLLDTIQPNMVVIN
jgi:hypothetical protein